MHHNITKKWLLEISSGPEQPSRDYGAFHFIVIMRAKGSRVQILLLENVKLIDISARRNILD